MIVHDTMQHHVCPKQADAKKEKPRPLNGVPRPGLVVCHTGRGGWGDSAFLEILSVSTNNLPTGPFSVPSRSGQSVAEAKNHRNDAKKRGCNIIMVL